MGRHFLLQGILLTQGSKPGLLHCRWVLYHLSHEARQSVEVIKSYKILEGRTLGPANLQDRVLSLCGIQRAEMAGREVSHKVISTAHLGPSSHRCDLQSDNGGTKNTHTHIHTHTDELNQQLY